MRHDCPVVKGLSPRVRGNPVMRLSLPGCQGSIPACAGEPSGSHTHSSTAPVYPRVCGGTYWRARCTASSVGLSPRVRGNRLHFGMNR